MCCCNRLLLCFTALYAGRMHVAPPSTRCSIHAAPCCRGTTPNTIHMFLLLLGALVLLLLLHAESLTTATRIGLPVTPPPLLHHADHHLHAAPPLAQDTMVHRCIPMLFAEGPKCMHGCCGCCHCWRCCWC